MRIRVASLLFGVGALLASGCGPGEIETENGDTIAVGEAADSLRTLFDRRAWDAGARLGERWTEAAPEALELRARTVELLGRDGRQNLAVAMADSMADRYPESPWSRYARAAALDRVPDRLTEAVSASAEGLRGRTSDPAFLRLRADVLRRARGPERSLAFLDSLPPDRRDDLPRLRVRRAYALASRAYMQGDSADRMEASRILEEVRRRDSTNVNARYFAGRQELSFLNHYVEGYRLYRNAAELTPAPGIHEAYWHAVWRHPEMSEPEKRKEIRRDVDDVLTRNDSSPAALDAAGDIYDTMGDVEDASAYHRQVLDRYPHSDEAEAVLVGRLRDLEDSVRTEREENGEASAATRAELRSALREFVGRDWGHRDVYLGEAYRTLFALLRDRDDSDPDSLYRAVRGMARYGRLNIGTTYAEGAKVLAEREAHLSYAAELPVRGMTEAASMLARRKASGVYDDPSMYREQLRYYWALMRDAVGWVYHHQGRREEALEQLRRVHDLRPEYPENLYHLGRVHENRADSLADAGRDSAADRAYAAAEEYYVEGAVIRQPGENPNEEALEQIFRKRHGSMEGFDRYVRKVEERSRRERKKEVLAERIEDPEPVEPFALESLSDSTVRFADMKGRVVVVDFWGTWCGPCVVEMDEFQEFFEKYRDHPEVVVLTIDEGETEETVREWMEKKEFTYPVLLDDGYISNVGVRAFPTTWFIDRQGRIAFTRRGTSGDLVQSFSWRVEALLDPGEG